MRAALAQPEHPWNARFMSLEMASVPGPPKVWTLGPPYP